MQQQHKRQVYRFFEDEGHGWLEVPLREVEAADAKISKYSYINRRVGLAYLEEDCDIARFMRAARLDWKDIAVDDVFSSYPRTLAYFDGAAV